MSDAAGLDKLVREFISYEPPMVRNFRTAIKKFKSDLPIVVESLREMIDEQVIDLLKRVTTVSVRKVEIMEEMEKNIT